MDLVRELKELIIVELDIKDISVEEIPDDEPVLGGMLDLDSIDALERGVVIQEKYGVKLQGQSEALAENYFDSIQSLANYTSKRCK